MGLAEFGARCREIEDTVDRAAQRAAVGLAAVSVAAALVLGALMALEWREAGRNPLGLNIRDGVYPPQVCEVCGRTLPHGVRWSEADGVWLAVCVPQGEGAEVRAEAARLQGGNVADVKEAQIERNHSE